MLIFHVKDLTENNDSRKSYSILEEADIPHVAGGAPAGLPSGQCILAMGRTCLNVLRHN